MKSKTYARDLGESHDEGLAAAAVLKEGKT